MVYVAELQQAGKRQPGNAAGNNDDFEIFFAPMLPSATV
jgi:hypothetical protein